MWQVGKGLFGGVSRMSWGMNMSCLIRVEACIPIGESMFEIQLINNHGWCGHGPENRYDVNELEIAKYPAWIYNPELKIQLGDKDYEALKASMHPICLNVKRIEAGDFDNITQDAYYAKEVGDINLYKIAIQRFRRLAVFL
jgi:hypothetical protein